LGLRVPISFALHEVDVGVLDVVSLEILEILVEGALFLILIVAAITGRLAPDDGYVTQVTVQPTQWHRLDLCW
jgi:hypothetical protein